MRNRITFTRAGLIDSAIFLAILSLAAVLRWIGIGSESIWLDEGYSWWDARQSLHDLWTLVPQCDPHPTLYFLLLKGWVDLWGDSLTAMRALSAFFGVATTALVILAGREISPRVGKRVGWVAGLLFAASPFQIYFAHEARPYALLCFGAAILLYGALRITRHLGQDERFAADISGRYAKRDWLVLVLGAVMIVWTNNTAVLILVALAASGMLLFAIDRHSRRYMSKAALAALAVLICWAPFLPILFQQMRGVSSDFWIQRPTLWSVGNEFHYLFGLDSDTAAWWMIVIACCGMILLLKRNWRMSLMLFGLAILPVLLNIGVSLTIKPIFISRAVIGVFPAFALCVASAIMLVRNRYLRAAILLSLFSVHAITVQGLLQSHGLKEPWPVLSERLMQEHGPITPTTAQDSVIMIISNELTLALTYTLSHGDFAEQQAMQIPRRGIPADYPAPGLAARYPSGKCDPAIDGFSMSVVDRAVAGRKQAFLITRRNNSYDPDNSIRTHMLVIGWIETDQSIFQPGDLQLHRFVPGPTLNPLSKE